MKKILWVIIITAMLSDGLWANVYYWPASDRMTARLRETWVDFDGIKMRTYTASVAGAKLEFSYLANYAVAETDGRWNVNFVIPEQPSVKIGVAGFRTGDFLPVVTPEVIKGYVDGLKDKKVTDVKSSVLKTLPQEMMVLGCLPEVVEYTTEAGIRRREYFVEAEGKIFVFGFEAPVGIFDDQKENARIVIARTRMM